MKCKKWVTLYDLFNDRERVRQAEDNCFKIRDEDPELFQRGVDVVRFLGMEGLWSGYTMALESVLYALKEEQRLALKNIAIGGVAGF